MTKENNPPINNVSENNKMVSESTGTLSYSSDDKVPIFYILFSCISHNK